MRGNSTIWTVLALMAGTVFSISCANSEVQVQTAPSYLFDPTWPQPLSNNWKMGGVTELVRVSHNRLPDLVGTEWRAGCNRLACP